MGKKIVVITGSPRKNGNSFAMTEAFGVLNEGDIEKTDGCRQAADLADKF